MQNIQTLISPKSFHQTPTPKTNSNSAYQTDKHRIALRIQSHFQHQFFRPSEQSSHFWMFPATNAKVYPPEIFYRNFQVSTEYRFHATQQLVHPAIMPLATFHVPAQTNKRMVLSCCRPDALPGLHD